jgi:hypothetical protein
MRLLVISSSAQCGIIFKYLHSRGYCSYYLLSVNEVINVLDYYLNLYTKLNNAVITICNLK